MDKKYIILGVVVVGIIALSIWSARNNRNKTATINETPEEVATNETFAIPTSGEYCYGRIQEATDTAPYSVEEHIILKFNDGDVVGIKSGTQAGPDMTNGYIGTLAGSAISNELGQGLQLVFEYEIEGSTNRELELYAVLKEGLVKERWVLEEANINDQQILVPDFQGDPMLIPYAVEPCAE